MSDIITQRVPEIRTLNPVSPFRIFLFVFSLSTFLALSQRSPHHPPEASNTSYLFVSIHFKVGKQSINWPVQSPSLYSIPISNLFL